MSQAVTTLNYNNNDRIKLKKTTEVRTPRQARPLSPETGRNSEQDQAALPPSQPDPQEYLTKSELTGPDPKSPPVLPVHNPLSQVQHRLDQR